MSDTGVGRDKGTVKFFDPVKGFGFCKREGGQQDVFIHANALRRSGITEGKVAQGDVLEFSVEVPEGKGPKASEIKILAKAAP